MTERRFGWVPQRDDPRDFPIEKLHDKLAARAAIPTFGSNDVLDLRPRYPVPCFDQKDLGSCVLNAVVRAAEYLGYQDVGKYIYRFSRLAAYYMTRDYEGSPNDDTGCEIRDAIKVAATQGLCGEWAWPYVVSKFAVKPPPFAYKNATTHLALEYYAIPDKTRHKDILTSLAAGYPVIMGFKVYQEFESEEVARTGMVPMPRPSEWAVGGHGTLIQVADPPRGLYGVANSWGKWGDGGFFWVPFDYFDDPDQADDFWVLHKEAGI